MRKFSIARMLQFCRLQLESSWFGNIWKLTGGLVLIVIFIILLSVTGGGSDIGRMMDTSENLLKVLVMMQIMGIYADIVRNDRPLPLMMIPASSLEKYISMYLSSAAVSLLLLAVSVTAGSGIYAIAGKILHPDNNAGINILFFREGWKFLAGSIETCLVSTTLVWMMPFVLKRKRYHPAVSCAVVAGFLAVLFLPAILMFAGVIPASAARYSSLAIMISVTIMNLRWGYVLFRQFEFDRKSND